MSVRVIEKWSVKIIYDFNGFGFEEIWNRRYRLLRNETEVVAELGWKEIDELKDFLKTYKLPPQKKLSKAIHPNYE